MWQPSWGKWPSSRKRSDLSCGNRLWNWRPCSKRSWLPFGSQVVNEIHQNRVNEMNVCMRSMSPWQMRWIKGPIILCHVFTNTEYLQDIGDFGQINLSNVLAQHRFLLWTCFRLNNIFRRYVCLHIAKTWLRGNMLFSCLWRLLWISASWFRGFVFSWYWPVAGFSLLIVCCFCGFLAVCCNYCADKPWIKAKSNMKWKKPEEEF